ncbi:cell division protein FtsA [Azospirillum doebereinerae]|uniref:Cell division protein FtsA n=1 Tax=Azospirillum doebereinerae TaxID=92933 RepID=A0A433JG20_9PROT|nr:cell division protein FtsA [Azospirillum doebereinerae]MCG5244276.1 cell division protein FtsA [Azospirillum doebereinerae]RUQ76133.1 cell division protein FtsA [Azospirillum doebereinerae]
MGFNGAKKPKRPTRGGIVAALDVGSTKVCCIIARMDEPGSFRVIGVGHQIATGIRAGSIIDMEAAETSIGAAVHAAEQMAGETIRDVVANLSMGHPRSHAFNAQIPVYGQEVTEGDIRRAMAHARTLQAGPDQTLIHTIPLGFNLDAARGIRDPRGMYGNQLGAQLHVVTASSGAIRTLRTCVARCHLDIESMVVSPFASGLACLVEDEMEMGAACIDIGGGGTTISIFSEGNLVWTGAVPLGGRHVTNDIAHGLATPLVHAERLKALYGSARSNPADEREMIEVPQVGEDERSESSTASTPRSFLVNIIQARMEEIFEEIRSVLEHSGYARLVGRRVVLTGGASQLPNTRELAQHILDKQVRIGRPTRIAGLNEVHGGPAFSTAAGLLLHAVRNPTELMVTGQEAVSNTGLLGRVGLWLRENL